MCEELRLTKCLLFDCDGTLVDSERLCNVALVVMFRELGCDLDVDELTLRFRGWKLASILEILQQENSLSLPNGFTEYYRKKVTELFLEELKPVPGIVGALEKLDYPMAVVSSGPRQKIEQALKICGLSKYFGSSIYSSYDVGAWKPDPRIYEFAAKDMGFFPAECSAIEDGMIGVEASVKAGIKTYFYNIHQDRCDWPEVSIFSSMSELPMLIAHNNQLHATSRAGA